MNSLALESRIKQSSKQKKPKNNFLGLRSCIDRMDIDGVLDIIETTPQLLTKPKAGENVLKYSIVFDKPKILTVLLEQAIKKHLPENKNGQNYLNDAIVQSIRFQKIKMLRIFLECGFDINVIVFEKDNLKFGCIDFAILGGHYQIANFLYPKLNQNFKNLKSTKQYQMIGKKYSYRYVNYQMFLQGMSKKTPPQKMGNYLKKQLTPEQKQKIRRIHNQGCWEFLMRIFGITKKEQENQVKSVKGDKVNIPKQNGDLNSDRPLSIKPQKIQIRQKKFFS